MPKGTYDSVRVGWHACVATGWTNASGASVAARPTGPTHDAYRHALGMLGAGDSNVALWALLLALIAIATHNADDYLERRKQTIETMRRFSDRFVHEFERPLITPGMPSPPIESRVRFAPHAARLEILLAPGAGHVYPNVTDHKRNLDYDVERVLHVLRERAVINGSPHMNGRWVVLPFHFKPATSQAGGR